MRLGTAARLSQLKKRCWKYEVQYSTFITFTDNSRPVIHYDSVGIDKEDWKRYDDKKGEKNVMKC